MAIETKPIRISAQLGLGDEVVRLLRLMADRIDKPRIETVAQYSGGVSNPPTQAEVTAVANKVNEVIVALINSGLMESP